MWKYGRTRLARSRKATAALEPEWGFHAAPKYKWRRWPFCESAELRADAVRCSDGDPQVHARYSAASCREELHQMGLARRNTFRKDSRARSESACIRVRLRPRC